MNNNLKPNKEYFIRYANNKYIGTYIETTTNLNGIQVYKFKNVSKIPIINTFTFDYSFPVNNTTLKPYISNSNSSVLGKRQTTTINDNNEQNIKISKTDMTFTEEEILKDREYWESVDGGKRKNKSKRKTRKIKSKKRKSRKYNK